MKEDISREKKLEKLIEEIQNKINSLFDSICKDYPDIRERLIEYGNSIQDLERIYREYINIIND